MGRRKGDTNADPETRLYRRVKELPGGCLQWLGTVSKKGYGRFYLNGRKVSTHRYAYELYNGPIPDGMQIDHICRNRSCVNPAHMELVSSAENTRRGYPGKRSKEREAENPPFDIDTLP